MKNQPHPTKIPIPLLCGMDIHSSSAQPHGTLATKAKRGVTVFEQHCIAYRNKQPGNTAPFGPPNLNGIFPSPSLLTTKQAEGIIAIGKVATPAWGAVLTQSDIDDMVAYLKTW